jgi:hypothetical protein
VVKPELGTANISLCHIMVCGVVVS